MGSNVFVLRCVKALVETTKRLAAGNLSARTGLSYDGGELGQLAYAFDEMATALEAREAEAKRSEERLREYSERLQILAGRLVEVQESERREIARELHNRVGQSLIALGINLNILRGHLPAEARGGAGDSGRCRGPHEEQRPPVSPRPRKRLIKGCPPTLMPRLRGVERGRAVVRPRQRPSRPVREPLKKVL